MIKDFIKKLYALRKNYDKKIKLRRIKRATQKAKKEYS